MNEIYWAPKAVRQLRKLDKTSGAEIRTAVGELVTFPDARLNIRRLVNHAHGYRLRIGRWRVIFDHDDTLRIISIEEVKKRDDNTY